MLKWALPLGAVLIVGCASKPAPTYAPERLPRASAATSAFPDDAEMNAAIAKAQQTLDSFIARLLHPQRGEVFSVAAKYKGPDGVTERLWIGDVTYKGDTFSGTLTLAPQHVTNHKYGDSMTVARKDVIDWMILKSGHSDGGYTEQVLLNREGQPR